MADYAALYGRPKTVTLTAGATVTGGQALYLSAADQASPATGPGQPFAGVAGHDAAAGQPVTVLMGGGIVHETPAAAAQLTAPAAPVPTTAATGGTVADGTYKVTVTYVTGAGETTASAQGQVTAAGGGTSTVTVPSPPALPGATGWYAYVSQPGGNTLTRQQTAGSPTAIGANLTLTAPPSSGGAQAPAGNTTAVAAGQPVATAAGGKIGQAGAGQQIGTAIRGPNAAGEVRWKATQ